MQDFLLPYTGVLAALTALGALVFVQILVADLAGLRAGHVPGMPVTDGHKSFLFRATRAHANTNENLGLLLLLSLTGMLLSASPVWLGLGAWLFVAARAAHMLCYYADWRMARSVAFGAGLLAQFALLVACLRALL